MYIFGIGFLITCHLGLVILILIGEWNLQTKVRSKRVLMSAHLILMCRLSKFESSMKLRPWFPNTENFPKWNHQMLFFYGEEICSAIKCLWNQAHIPFSVICWILKYFFVLRFFFFFQKFFFSILLIWLVVQFKQLIEVKPITICWLLIKYKHVPGFWEWQLNHSTIYRRLQCADFIFLSFKITVNGDCSQEI